MCSRRVHVAPANDVLIRARRSTELEQLVHTQSGDREESGLESYNPLVLFQIPEMKSYHGLRTLEYTLELHRSNARLARMIAADNVQNRHDPETNGVVGGH